MWLANKKQNTLVENVVADSHGKYGEPIKFVRLATLRRLIREPMLHFLIAGGALFIAAQSAERFHENAAKAIVIDTALKNRLIKLYEIQMGAPPSATQFAQIIDTYVHDEVLYREALQLGLDKGDEIIRRRLVQKMSFLQSDLAIAAEPSERSLRSYYERHQAEFAEPERISFQQLFFNADGSDGGDGLRRATAALAQLKTGGSPSVDGADRSSLDARYRRLGRGELSRLFGATPIVEHLLNSASGTWSGPVRSGYGWHLIRVDEHVARQVPSFEAVRERVANAVNTRVKEENNQRNYRDLLAHYAVNNGPELLLP